jgi:antitoxin HicB
MPVDRVFTIVLTPQSEGGFCVTVPELPEVVTEGDTEEESLAMAKEAIELALEHRLAEGDPLPEGRRAKILDVSVSVAA